MNPIPLYEMFPFIKESGRLATDYTGARVCSVSVNQAKTTMNLTISTQAPVPPYEISIMEDLISNEFGINTVSITCTCPTPVTPSPASPKSLSSPSSSLSPKSSPSPKSSSAPIMGRVTKTKPTPMGDLTLDLGRVTVKGEVFAVRSRFIEKSNSWLFNFDMTDYTGSINVTKFMRDDKASKIANSVKEGMHLVVSGTLGINKFDNELTLDPQNIFPYTKTPRTDTAEEKRVELHLHTKMSAMDALTDIEEAITRAADWGHPAVAITDHGVVHSFPTAALTAKKLGNKIKIIYGVEAYLRNDIPVPDPGAVSETSPQKKPKRQRNNHIILLVKNKTGLHNLYKLITISHLEHYDSRPIIYKSILEKHKEGLIIGSACESGEIFKALINNPEPRELQEIAKLYDYFEIMPVCNNAFMLYEENPKAQSEEDLRNFNRKIIELGKTLNKPVVATSDVHFLDPEHEIYRKILQTSKGFSDTNEDLPLYFKTTDEMLDEFQYLGEETAYEVVIKNPKMIADMCETVNPLPEPGQLYPPKLSGSAEDLQSIVQKQTLEFYGENPPEIIPKRINYELHDILRLNYDVIYMAAQRLVVYLKEHKSRVGSRGSVGSSLVAFLAGITEVNPLPPHYRCPKCKQTIFLDYFSHPNVSEGKKNDASAPQYACGADMPDQNCPTCNTLFLKDGFNIPFETFMGYDGAKVPDIDLNISSEHQALAHKFTSDMFGSEYVYRAGTIGTVQFKTAFGYAKKYLESIGKSATRAEEGRLAQGCVGVKHTTGQHPGGLIVIPQETTVTDFSPAHYPANEKEKGVVTLHFEYAYIEDNLIKLDILGHENPTMLRMLEGITGINADDIDLNQPETLKIFSSPIPLGLPEDDIIIGETGTIGIPEFGTPFTRQMLCDTRPKNFDTLVRLSGFSHGTGVWAGNAKELIERGTATIAETISSREDMILFLVSKGMDDRYAFKISESVRKGRGLPEGSEEEMIRCKIPAWYIESCKTITYLFPKAHATAYVMMAFRIAWFKVHKPLEFYSAHFYRRRKNFDAELMARGKNTVLAKIKEIKNIPNPPKKEEELLTTLESCYEYYMRGFDFANIDLYDSDPEKFIPVDEKTLRPPFIVVNGLGDAAAHDLAEQRKTKQFISIDEIFADCPGVNKTNLDKLKTLGALRDLPDSSQMTLF